MESINNDYILKLFNLDNRKISSIEVHHQFDGVHVHVLLAVEPYRCPVCGTETSKTHSYNPHLSAVNEKLITAST